MDKKYIGIDAKSQGLDFDEQVEENNRMLLAGKIQQALQSEREKIIKWAEKQKVICGCHYLSRDCNCDGYNKCLDDLIIKLK